LHHPTPVKRRRRNKRQRPTPVKRRRQIKRHHPSPVKRRRRNKRQRPTSPTKKSPRNCGGPYHYFSVFVYSSPLSVAASSPSSSSISRTLYISYCVWLFPLWMTNA